MCQSVHGVVNKISVTVHQNFTKFSTYTIKVFILATNPATAYIYALRV